MTIARHRGGLWHGSYADSVTGSTSWEHSDATVTRAAKKAKGQIDDPAFVAFQTISNDQAAAFFGAKRP
jgi:ubiquitin C-terminal hydrolase